MRMKTGHLNITKRKEKTIGRPRNTWIDDRIEEKDTGRDVWKKVNQWRTFITFFTSYKG